MASQRDYALILFDGLCHLCSWSIVFVIRRDPQRRFRFVPFQSPLGSLLSVQYGISAHPIETFALIDEAGQCYTKSGAALKIAKGLSGMWPVLGVLVFVPTAIRDGLYDWVVRNRYKIFGRRESCFVPPQDLGDRFLER